jgi:hypothetical protein
MRCDAAIRVHFVSRYGMSRWAEVDCNCIEREPLPNSDLFDQPYYHKRRLTTKQQEEVDEWERTTMAMYACGHRLGILVALSPGDMIFLGGLIDRIFKDMEGEFEIFPRVGNWHEVLLLSPEEAALWLLEIDELQNATVGFGSLPREKMEKLVSALYFDELIFPADSGEQLEPLISKKQALVEQKRATVMEWLSNTLADATKLCNASIETGNPIRML